MMQSLILVFFMKKLQRHPLITGTIVLTITGLISRIIGFFYRIYLSRLFGEEGMGIYQLLSPVLALSFSLTAAGYQTAISKFVAEGAAREKHASYKPLIAGLSISIPLSLICNAVVYLGSEYIASSFLMETRCASMLRILSFSIPLSAVHSCINGYFYGVKKTGIPAATQLLEQCCRVGCVYAVAGYAIAQGSSPSINVAVLGLVVGELFSMLMSVIAVYLGYCRERSLSPAAGKDILASASSGCLGARNTTMNVYRQLLGMALPLTANRIVLNMLQSVEAVSIPSKLRLYGYDNVTALSVYGVLTGMAMPLIFFPNALTNSVSVLLLPIISESYALGDMETVKKSTLKTVKYCAVLGFICMGGFLALGRWAGVTLFNSELAGHFIVTLSFICPFIYLDTTLSSILQGLGMAGRIFFMNVTCLLVRLGFIFYAVPIFGITGYLWGILASQMLLCVLYLGCLFLMNTKRKKRSLKK